MLARAGAPVVMIARQPFVDAVRGNGLSLDTTHGHHHVQVEASTDLSAARDAQLVLFCVKTVDNAAAACSLAPLLAPDAIVLSMQNGVDNAEQIRAASGIEALSMVVYIGASVSQPGHIKHAGRGDLVVGPESPAASRVAAIFQRAEVPCRVSNNIEGEMWVKFLANCGLNAVSAVGRVRYGTIAADPAARKLVEAVVNEAMDVALAAGVVMPGVSDRDSGLAGVLKIATQMPAAFSSTAQDVFRGKRTEIDSLNGYIARRGAELGVPTPVNQAIHTLTRLAEKNDP
jgi:2-dehydropantoate 2-reductase